MRLASFLLLFFAILSASAQTAPDKYWVQFTDKDNVLFSVDQPAEFLSSRALERRERFGISITEQDLPVDENYVEQVLDLGDVSVVHRSKWFNAVTIFTEDSTLIEDIALLPFVHETRQVQVYTGDRAIKPVAREKSQIQSEGSYGWSFPQISIHNGQLLHELGYHGEGMSIGVLDAGFKNADENIAFETLRNDGRIKMTRDFVESGTDIYSEHHHGALVLSTMAAYYPDSIIGTAFMADYYLIRTEEAAQENVVEEDNWVAAIEFCDSLGLDLINTSLGYSTFDDSTMNHVYDDLDGNTARITIASDIAACKGMLLVTSAGNSGNSEWHYITAPADADSSLTVGAVDPAGNRASFSSFGPTSDGRVKPDVMAIGRDAAYVATNGHLATGNGTSFSSPIMAGLTACLWQAFPEKSNMEIIDAIRQSAHTHTQPSDSLGYGIPDFWKAFNILREAEINVFGLGLEVFPNPFSDHVSIVFNAADPASVEYELYDASGRLIYLPVNAISAGATRVQRLDIEFGDFPKGIYFMRVRADGLDDVARLLRY